MKNKRRGAKKVIFMEDVPDVHVHIINKEGREVYALIPKMKSRLMVGDIYVAAGKFEGGDIDDVFGTVVEVEHRPEEGLIEVDVRLSEHFDGHIDALIAAGWEEVGEKPKA